MKNHHGPLSRGIVTGWPRQTFRPFAVTVWFGER